jgi:hypothetical protein
MLGAKNLPQAELASKSNAQPADLSDALPFFVPHVLEQAQSTSQS